MNQMILFICVCNLMIFSVVGVRQNVALNQEQLVLQNSQSTAGTTSLFSDDEYVRGCYFTNWAQHRDGPYAYTPDDIDPDLCNVIFYAFAKLDADLTIQAFEWNDLDSEWSEGMMSKVVGLKKKNPKLKVLVSLGGWTMNDCSEDPETCTYFSKMASTPESRTNFIDSAFTFIYANGFDGLDIDWEYPGDKARNGNTTNDDKSNFVKLVNEFRSRAESKAQESGTDRLILTAAVGVSQTVVENAYDITGLCNTNTGVDFINMMTYDMHGAWEHQTAHNAPLYATTEDIQKWGTNISASWAVEYWINHGCSPRKLVMGLATYGRGYSLSEGLEEYGFGTNASGASPPGAGTKSAGMYAYYEVALKVNTQELTYKFDQNRGVPYAYNKNVWIGYDDERSFAMSCEYVISKGLLGAMIWTLDMDMFQQKKYPLLRSMNDALLGKTSDNEAQYLECPAKLGPEFITSQLIPQFPSGVWNGSDCSPYTLRTLRDNCFAALTNASLEDEKLACVLLNPPGLRGIIPLGMYPTSMKLDKQLSTLTESDLVPIFNRCALPKMINDGCFSYMRNTWNANYHQYTYFGFHSYARTVGHLYSATSTASVSYLAGSISQNVGLDVSITTTYNQTTHLAKTRQQWSNDFGTMTMESCMQPDSINLDWFNPNYLNQWKTIENITSVQGLLNNGTFRLLADQGHFVPTSFSFAVQYSVDTLSNATALVNSHSLLVNGSGSVKGEMSGQWMDASATLGLAAGVQVTKQNVHTHNKTSVQGHKYGRCRFDLMLKYPKQWSQLLEGCAISAASKIESLDRAAYIPKGGFTDIYSILDGLGIKRNPFFEEAISVYFSYCMCDGKMERFTCFYGNGTMRAGPTYTKTPCINPVWGMRFGYNMTAFAVQG